MGNADVAEEVNEWENIQPPYSVTPTTAQWDDDDDDDMVVVRDTSSNDSSIFPPSNHEGLPVAPPRNHHLQEPPATPSLLSSSGAEDDGEVPLVVGSEVGRRLRARLEILSSGIIRVAYGIRSYAVYRVGFWSIASAIIGLVAAVLVTLYGRRLQRWQRRVEQENKDQLMLLIRQKDQVDRKSTGSYSKLPG